MKNLYLVLLVAFSFWSHGSDNVAAQEKSADTLIKGGQYFDVESGQMKPNSGIAILDGRFVEATTAKEVIELDDSQFVLPGLIDCHAHYNLRLIKKRREEFEFMPIVYLANGATVTFSCGEFDPESMLAMRKRIESGEQIGPRLITSGPYFGRARPGWRPDKPEQEIRDEVDFWAKQGTGGFKAKSIDPDSLKILIDQAHKHGLTVTGHLGSGFRDSVNPRDAVSMGIDRIEHFLGGEAMPDSKSAYQRCRVFNQALQHSRKSVSTSSTTMSTSIVRSARMDILASELQKRTRNTNTGLMSASFSRPTCRRSPKNESP